MDGLSGVASGMAVASLSIQLLESIGTIRAFIRDVKGASKELQRLAELLGRLYALLEDVRNAMKPQTSLQGQHLPAPSTTIFNSLKSCEESLRVLEQTVEKYRNAKNGASSAITRLKEDVRFGFKTKDIAGFEARIQRDIDYLQTALGVNITNILTMTFPVLLQSQQTCMTLYSQTSHQSYLAPAQHSRIPHTDQDLSSVSKSSDLKLITHQYQISSLERFGIYQNVSVRAFQNETRERFKKKVSTNDVISETRDVILNWKLLKLGLQWTRKYPYGSIWPSLAVYPVIGSVFEFHYDLIRDASVFEIQQKISTGQLHPFTRDCHGLSLLHLAAMFHRADVCRLLIQHGVRSSLTLYNVSPFSRAIGPGLRSSETNQIDTFRCLLGGDEEIDDVNCNDRWFSGVRLLDVGTLQWLWTNAGQKFAAGDLVIVRSCLLWGLVSKYSRHVWAMDTAAEDEALTDRIVRLVDDEIRHDLVHGKTGLIRSLFYSQLSSMESQRVGSALIVLLRRLGLDVKACIEMELANLSEGLLDPYSSRSDRLRKIIFEPGVDGDWTLRWVWSFDPQEPGYLLASEYVSLGADSGRVHVEWPFYEADRYLGWDDWNHEYHKGAKYDARRECREASKARKERARTGQKRTKSKMPGTWNW